jgi:hypothetical protein
MIWTEDGISIRESEVHQQTPQSCRRWESDENMILLSDVQW